jgi:hypothetical protein
MHRENLETVILTKFDSCHRDGVVYPPLTAQTSEVRQFGEFRDTGPDDPNWRKKLREKKPVFTLLSGQKFQVVNRPGMAFRSYAYSTTDMRAEDIASQGNLYPGVGFGNLPDTSLQLQLSNNQAYETLIKRARKVQSAFNGGAFLAELGGTLRMLRSPTKQLWGGIRDYYHKARAVVRGARTPSTQNRLLRDTWLEYSFGWAPLVSDIDDACKALRRMSKIPMPIYKKISSGLQEPFHLVYEDKAGTSNHFGSSLLVWDYRSRNVWECTTLYQAFVHLDVDENGFRLVRENYGLQAQDFFPSVWEAIPYSFLVDYFTNIGDIISTLSFNKSSISPVWKTVRTKQLVGVYDVRLRPYTGSRPVLGELMNPGTYSRAISTVQRAPSYDVYSPQVSFKIPGLGLKWLNMASLARYRRLI